MTPSRSAISFFYRLASLAIRFGCPILVLRVSTPELLGRYYLFTAFFTSVVYCISLETSQPFSRQFLTTTNEIGKRKVFRAFVTTQALLSLTLSLPCVVFYALWMDGGTLLMAPLLFLAFVTEACVNESGRFFWNVGESDVASKQVFLRAVSFVLAITSSVLLLGRIVSVVSLGIIVAANAALMIAESRRWGVAGSWTRMSWGRVNLLLGLAFKRVKSAVKESSGQVVHVQVLSLQPLLERLLIEHSIGAAAVGSFAFQYSIIQSGSSILLMPYMAKTRQKIFGAITEAEIVGAKAGCLRILGLIALMSVVGGLAAHFTLPIVRLITSKNISSDTLTLGVAMVSSGAATFAANVAPLFVSRGRRVAANIEAAACLLPMALVYVLSKVAFDASPKITMLAVLASAILQIVVRALRFVPWRLRAG